MMKLELFILRYNGLSKRKLGKINSSNASKPYSKKVLIFNFDFLKRNCECMSG